MIPSLLQIPSAVSDSKLHSVLPNNGKGDFQFDRSTGATRINKDGLIEEVGYFSSELVQNGNFSELGSELVTNGDFATNSDWSLGTGWSINDGKAVGENAGSPSVSYLSQDFAFVSGKTYKVVYTVSEYVKGNVRPQLASPGSQNLPNVSANGTYTEYIVANNNFSKFRFRAATTDGGFTGKIDNVSVKQVDPNDRWDAEFYGTDVTITDTLNLVDNGNSGGAGVFQSATIENGKTYKIKFDITASTGSSIVALMFCDNRSGSNQGVVSNYFSAVGSYDLRLTANKDNLGFRFRFARSAGKTASIDNVSIVEVQGDRPRLSYDITNGIVEDTPHLLLEPSSTNRIKFSEDFSQWNKLGSTTVEFVADLVNPDGSVGGYKISGEGIFVNDGSGISGAVTSILGRSIYARTVSGTGNVQLLSHNTNTNNVFTVNETWQRFELNSAINVSSNYYGVDFRGASSTLSEIYLFAAQLDSINIVTSYIKTAGTTITRAAETCNNSKPSVNSTEGVFYLEVQTTFDSSKSRRISISDGTISNRIAFEFDEALENRLRIHQNSGLIDYNAPNLSVFNKIAYKFKSGDNDLWFNGSQVANSISTNMPSGMNVLQLQGGGNTNTFYGKVKGLAVYNEALSESQLFQLTGVTASSIYSNFVTRTASFTVEALNEVKKVIDNL